MGECGGHVWAPADQQEWGRRPLWVKGAWRGPCPGPRRRTRVGPKAAVGERGMAGAISGPPQTNKSSGRRSLWVKRAWRGPCPGPRRRTRVGPKAAVGERGMAGAMPGSPGNEQESGRRSLWVKAAWRGPRHGPRRSTIADRHRLASGQGMRLAAGSFSAACLRVSAPAFLSRRLPACSAVADAYYDSGNLVQGDHCVEELAAR
jgi:hypothetical protein